MSKRFFDDAQEDFFSLREGFINEPGSKLPSFKVRISKLVKAALKDFRDRFLLLEKVQLELKKRESLVDKKLKGKLAKNLNQNRDLIPIKSDIIYQREIKKRLKEEKKIESIKLELQDFLKKDVPAFEEWKNATFSAEISQLKELNEELEKAAQLRWEGPNSNNSFDPENPNADGFESHGSDFQNGMNFFESDKEDPDFQKEFTKIQEEIQKNDILKKHLSSLDFEADIETIKWKKDLVLALFKETKEKDWELFSDRNNLEDFREILMYHLGTDEELMGFGDIHLTEKAIEFFSEELSSRRQNNTHEARFNEDEHSLKVIYKMLAVKLHPDKLGGEVTAQQKKLWDQLSEAFQEKDLEKMKKVQIEYWLKFEPESGRLGFTDLKAIESEQKTELKALRAELKKIKKNLEYGFLKLDKSALSDLKKEFKKHLKEMVRDINAQLRWLKRIS
jgi:hypothetical protein